MMRFNLSESLYSLEEPCSRKGLMDSIRTGSFVWFAVGTSTNESVSNITNYKAPVILKLYKNFLPCVENFLKNETIT